MTIALCIFSFIAGCFVTLFVISLCTSAKRGDEIQHLNPEDLE